MILRSLLTTSALVFSLLPYTSSAKKDEPTISVHTFDNALENVFYFDDSNVLLGQDREGATVYRSEDAGETWKPVDDDKQAGNSWDLWPHPWDNQRAYIIGIGKEHWMTKDQGKTWTSFNSGSLPSLGRGSPFSFHGRDPAKVIWNGESCAAGVFLCEHVTFYTTDDFKHTETLTKGTKGGCVWAVGTPQFSEDKPEDVSDRVFCVKEGLYSRWPKDFRLTYSDDYFDQEEVEPALDGGRAVTGIISMAAVKRYLVAAAKSEGSDELGLYVTIDGKQWHRAEFGDHRIEEDAYTVLESTNYSMQVDVLASLRLNPMGYLFTSNSNGTYFTRNIDHTNRSPFGRVDFEKVANIQGIVLVNLVDNWEKVGKQLLTEKQIISKISFDDGRTFQDLKSGKHTLHLHSVTDQSQGGRVFSSPAPGMMMGIGNTGKLLKGYKEGDLYVSDDAGQTWIKGLDGPHLYEFGNQGAVIVAIEEGEQTSHLRYSLNHGKDFKKVDLGIKMTAKFLTTVPDSTTLKFLLIGTQRDGSDVKWPVVKIDFEGLHERACGKGDFEDKWPARVDDDGNPSCIMGHKQFFRRRKADADCFIDGEFKDPVPTFEPCECTEFDFECDFNFIRSEDRTKCVPARTLPPPEGECKKETDTYVGSSGWRKIAGNECKGGIDLSKEKERSCSDTIKEPPSGEIAVEKTSFKAGSFWQWHYLEGGKQKHDDGETVVMQTDEREIYMTRDHGKTWARILEDKPIIGIIPNPHFYESIYFVTGKEKVYYTINAGDTFSDFTAPAPPPDTITRDTLKFHPQYKDWLLWSGLDGSDGQLTVFSSTSRGGRWDPMVRAAKKCEYINREDKDKLIFCAQYENEDSSKSVQLVSSDNFFAAHETHFNNILDFATMSEFIVVAQRLDGGEELRVDASVNGGRFAAAEFPRNFQVKHQQAYTVLDSSTHAVFLHVTVNPRSGQEYGTIIKSNSNGTSYVKILDYVNRDTPGYVDFEKMQHLEGVAMVNVVSNPQGVEGGDKKLIKSKISHNDGSDWTLLPPPKKDAIGGAYKCVSTDNEATEDCSLHIHHYTERKDKSATFSSPTSVGLMMAVGNVGPHLLRKDDAATDTFITRDAGISWKSVKKGSYMWEFGDQGSIIVIVRENEPTKTAFYTLNEGESWKEFKFSDVDMEITAITTVPSDTSRNFMLWGKEVGPGANIGHIATVNLDFTGLEERSRMCDLDEAHPGDSPDFILWKPSHPFQKDGCLFGHVAQYHRKKLSSDCYIGARLEDGPHSIERNCTCRREDYECDFNYQKQGDGTCRLVEGLEPPNHEQYCKDHPDAIQYNLPTGYRRIPLSTCEGGTEFDVSPHACPGHQEDFDRKHGGRLGGVAIFFILIVSLAAAGGIGYWVWDQYQKRGGFGGLGFGSIRLGEGIGSAGTATRSALGGGSGESPFITIPVAIISGVVAIARALPLLATSLFRSAKGYTPLGSRAGNYGGGGGGSGPYRSRDAFASRRPDYSSGAAAAYVEDDELLGDEDDDAEEV